MEVEELAIPKKQAEQTFTELKTLLRQNMKLQKEQMYKDQLRVYGHLQHGKKIIDIYESFKKAGLNIDSDPKLAIARADVKQCFARKYSNGSIMFSDRELGRYDQELKSHADVKIPAKTFSWQKIDESKSLDNWDNNIKNVNIKTIVPIIPPKILVNEVKVLLKNFHILWEVEEWKPIPPKDPILLKRLTPNLFGVLATWDLTSLERAIIRGRIQV